MRMYMGTSMGGIEGVPLKRKRRRQRERRRGRIWRKAFLIVCVFAALGVGVNAAAKARRQAVRDAAGSKVTQALARPGNRFRTPVQSGDPFLKLEPPDVSPWSSAQSLLAVQKKAERQANISERLRKVKSEKKENQPPVIFIDPGHGGEDQGCVKDGIPEKEINLEIALQVAEALKELGYQTVMTREEDTEVSPEDRVTAAEKAQADVFVSIHQNGCTDGGAAGGDDANGGGIAAWCRKEDDPRLAGLMQMYAVQDAKAQDGDLREYEEKLASGIAQGIDLYFHPKTMYLTFDDGPSAENTDKILDVLAEKDIKATFFLIGENVRKHPETAQRIAEEGHTIGIHCNRHDYSLLYESVDSYAEDFEAAWQTVKEVTGVEAVLFRFPGGSINSYNKDVYQDIIEEMTGRGYIYFDWNASLEDAVKHSTPEQLLKNARESTLGRKKVVMLAHDVKDNTALCLEDLIEQFPEYRMEPLTEEVTPVQFKGKESQP